MFYKGLLVAAMCVAFAGTASAQVFKMECAGEKASYSVVYDHGAKVFGNQNPSFVPPYGMRQTQVDEDGALVWAFVRVHYGERDMLARFGREKWIRYFYANGSVVTHTCR